MIEVLEYFVMFGLLVLFIFLVVLGFAIKGITSFYQKAGEPRIRYCKTCDQSQRMLQYKGVYRWESNEVGNYKSCHNCSKYLDIKE